MSESEEGTINIFPENGMEVTERADTIIKNKPDGNFFTFFHHLPLNSFGGENKGVALCFTTRLSILEETRACVLYACFVTY